MNTNKIHLKKLLKHLNNAAESLIELLKVYGVIKPLQRYGRVEEHKDKIEVFKSMFSGTVGSDLAKMLDQHDLQLIPYFEDHDLKHLILQYGMTPQEELKMQMYLLGNGNHSLWCLLFVASGLLFPTHWSDYYTAFLRGKNSPSILNLTIDDCMALQTEDIRMDHQPSYHNSQSKLYFSSIFS